MWMSREAVNLIPVVWRDGVGRFRLGGVQRESVRFKRRIRIY